MTRNGYNNSMETSDAVLKALKIFNLSENSTLESVRKSYLDKTDQQKFKKIFLGDDALEKEFVKYYEAYIQFLRHHRGSDPGLSVYPVEIIFRFILNQGIYHLIKQQYIKAAEKFQEAYKLNNSDNLLIIYLGIILIRRKNYYAAEKYLIKALEKEKQNDDIYFYLGEIYLKTGKFEKSEQMFETCKNLNPLRHEVALKIKEIKDTSRRQKSFRSGFQITSFLNKIFKKNYRKE